MTRGHSSRDPRSFSMISGEVCGARRALGPRLADTFPVAVCLFEQPRDVDRGNVIGSEATDLANVLPF